MPGADHGLPAHITQIETMGREVLYRVETSIGVLSLLEVGIDDRAFQRGELVQLMFTSDNILVYDKSTEALLEGCHAELNI